MSRRKISLGAIFLFLCGALLSCGEAEQPSGDLGLETSPGEPTPFERAILKIKSVESFRFAQTGSLQLEGNYAEGQATLTGELHEIIQRSDGSIIENIFANGKKCKKIPDKPWECSDITSRKGQETFDIWLMILGELDIRNLFPQAEVIEQGYQEGNLEGKTCHTFYKVINFPNTNETLTIELCIDPTTFFPVLTKSTFITENGSSQIFIESYFDFNEPFEVELPTP